LKISKVLELPEGFVRFEGELSPEETDYVLGFGLNYLYHMGKLTVSKMVAEEEEAVPIANVLDGNDTVN
jgi:hypothetical protein